MTGRSIPHPADLSWHADAICRQTDPEVFFHPAGESGAPRARRTEEAKAVCRSCPVMMRCRDHALDRREQYGVWGGLSEDERAKVLRDRDNEQRRARRKEAAKEEQEAKPEPGKRRQVEDRTPCGHCGKTMRSRRRGRTRLEHLPDGEVFHRSGGLCAGCYGKGNGRTSFTARWEITELGMDMTLAQLIIEASKERLAEAARTQRVQLIAAPDEMSWRIDSTRMQLVVSGPAKLLESEVAA